MGSTIQYVKTPEGTMPVEQFRPADSRPVPTVIFYMDGIGPRPALSAMAAHLSAAGYNVLLPNLFYRSGPWKPLVATEAFKEGPSRQQMQSAMGRLTLSAVASDTAGLINYADAELGATGRTIGCVGYCMGGSHAFTAAANHPGRVGAVAVFHSAQLVTDQPDSPHRRLRQMTANVYVGVAGIDPWLKPDETSTLKNALAEAGIRHTLEVYPEVSHGFAVTDTPAHNAVAEQRHWDALLSLLRSSLREEV